MLYLPTQTVSSSTLFGSILQTPVHHRPTDHEQCSTSANAKEEGDKDTALVQLDPPCKPQTEMLVRPLQKLGYVCLEDNAYLISNDSANSNWTTQIRLHGGWLGPSFEVKESQHTFDTLFELLKLAGKHPGADSLRELEARDIQGGEATSCRQLPEYRQHHLGLDMTKEGFDVFFERVSRSFDILFRIPTYSALFSQFSKEVVIHPEIFLNRIEIVIRAEIHFLVMSHMVDQLVSLYQQHALPHQKLLLGVGPPYQLVTLFLDDYPAGQERAFEDLMVPMEKMSVQIDGTEGEMMFVNSDIAYTANLHATFARFASMHMAGRL